MGRLRPIRVLDIPNLPDPFSLTGGPVAADKGIAAWASVVLPFIVVAACMGAGRRRAERA